MVRPVGFAVGEDVDDVAFVVCFVVALVVVVVDLVVLLVVDCDVTFEVALDVILVVLVVLVTSAVALVLVVSEADESSAALVSVIVSLSETLDSESDVDFEEDIVSVPLDESTEELSIACSLDEDSVWLSSEPLLLPHAVASSIDIASEKASIFFSIISPPIVFVDTIIPLSPTKHKSTRSH